MRKTSTKNPGATSPRAAAKSERTEYDRALDSLTRYLAIRDHSQYELRTKLARAYPEELVDELLAEAARNGWLIPEQQIAERLALALAKRHKSQMYIVGQLQERRLPVPDLQDDSENARLLVERKFGAGSLDEDVKGKAFRFLQNRGFDDRVIRQVLNEER